MPDPPAARRSSFDLRGVLTSTTAGAGVTVLPRYLCANELASGELVPLLQPEIPPINTLFLATRTGTTELPHIAAVRGRLLAQAPLWLEAHDRAGAARLGVRRRGG
ncbi:MAG: LysR substrate-binding domain-containing protein [Streptosporangiaceae bacterium]